MKKQSKGKHTEASNTVGAALIALLDLPINAHGRVDTSIGDKTEYGLAKTIERIFADDKFAKSIAKGHI